jgi:hypothetical protein
MIVTTLDMVMMYMVIFIVIICAVWITASAVKVFGKHETEYPMGGAEWGPMGIGKTMDGMDSVADLWLDVFKTPSWCYVDMHDQAKDVSFDDPADAYEYVVAAIKDKEAEIERIEHAQWAVQGLHWTWIDTHMEREYWLDMLKEFKEDC